MTRKTWPAAMPRVASGGPPAAARRPTVGNERYLKRDV